MQASIHPKQFQVKITCSGCGNKFNIVSTKDTKENIVEFCCNCHKAWKKGGFQISKDENIDKFNQRYQGLFMVNKKSKET